MSRFLKTLAAAAVLATIAAPLSASAQVNFLSVGGTVAGPTGMCLSLNGGVGELFHLIPDARTVPLVPPDYIWTPTTITLPVPGRPPTIGQQVLGLVYPGFGQGLCIRSFFPFFSVGGWQFYYIGESSAPGAGIGSAAP